MKMKRVLSIALVLCLCLISFAPAFAKSEPKSLLRSIDDLAQHGWILNCDFRLTDMIGDMKKEYGRPSSEKYVKSAKGTYCTWNSNDFVAGYNKGEQIFELRSFDSRLSKLTLDSVTSHFGSPDKITRSNGELFVSYVLNKRVNIKFVFPNKKGDPKLSHYNVIYLQGTKNNMADDKGRKW